MSDKKGIASENVEKTVVGKLFQRREETVVIWKILNFTKKLSVPEDTEYHSPTFAFLDTIWFLSLCIEGTLYESEESIEYIGLYLYSKIKRKYDCTITLTMSVKNAEGDAEFSDTCTEEFESYIDGCGVPEICVKSELMNSKSKLLPGDTLTIECALERNDSSLLGVPRMERLLNLQEDFKKILTEKETCDLVLKLDGQEIKAHKVILQNRCKVFQSMLSHDMAEKRTGEITIDDIEPGVFQEVLAYMYCGEVANLSTENMCKIYVAADKYQLDELKRLCATFIEENLTVDLFCDVLAIPDTCIHVELKLILTEFFCKNFMSIIVTEKWKHFDEENKEVTHELLLSSLKVKCS